MARAARLKLFRTPMGFFDAVVAAPSQAAALKAWGVSSNLFAEGLAAEVKDDPALLAEASAAPGEVLRKTRGDPEELLSRPAPPRRAKAASGPHRNDKHAPTPKTAPPVATPPVSTPKQDRSALDAAERSLARAQTDLADALKAIDEERAELDAQEARTRREGERAIAKAAKAVAMAKAVFDAQP